MNRNCRRKTEKVYVKVNLMIFLLRLLTLVSRFAPAMRPFGPHIYIDIC